MNNLEGIFTIKNAISGGYFAIESILAVLPVVDKIHINDGGSEDGTLEAFRELQEVFPNKIKLYNIPDTKTPFWQVIDIAIEKLIKEVKSEWIFEVQGDEIYHEKTLFEIPELLIEAKNCNGIRHRRFDLNFGSIKPFYIMPTIRLVKNHPKLRSIQGGDSFYFDGQPSVREGFTCHNVPPELDTDKAIIYHYPQAFPENRVEKGRRMAIELASQDKTRTDFYKSCLHEVCQKAGERQTIDKFAPALVRHLAGSSKYKLRRELFDIDWLTRNTKIDYGAF